MSGLAFEGWGGGGGAIPNPLPIARGGTGAQDVPGILSALGLAAGLPTNAGLIERQGIPLIEGGWAPVLFGAAPGFAAGAAVQRASGATAVVDGVLTEVASGAPRWADWTPAPANGARALLLGGQRTNLVRNPRALGAVVGAFGVGATPTHWSGLGGGGYSHLLATGVESGIPYVDLRCQQPGAGTCIIAPETIAVTPGQIVAAAINATLIGGTLANVIQLHIALTFFDGPNGTGGLVSNVLATAIPLASGPLLTAEYFASTTVPAGAQSMAFRVRAGTTGAVDYSIRVGAPRLITGSPLVGTPVFPPGTTLAASTRLADVIPPLAVAGPATLRLEGALPTLPPSGGENMLLGQFDGGADADRLRVHVAAGGTQIVAGRVVGGVVTDATALGTVTPGGRWVVLLRHDGAGNIGACMSGASSVTTQAGGLAGVTSLLLGNNRSGSAPLFGLVRSARLWARALTDAEMLAQLT